MTERSLDELLNAAASAPTFGLTGRELILQASRQIAKEYGATGSVVRPESPKSKPTRPCLEVGEVRRLGPLCFNALPKAQRPMIPFKVQQGKVPRINRQSVLDKLTGQHLALALHSAGKTPSPAAVAQSQAACEEAVMNAKAQEAELFKKGRASKTVYLNFTARSSASAWLDSKKVKVDPSEQYEEEPIVADHNTRLDQPNAIHLASTASAAMMDSAENADKEQSSDKALASANESGAGGSTLPVGKKGDLETQMLQAAGLESPDRSSEDLIDCRKPDNQLVDSEVSRSPQPAEDCIARLDDIDVAQEKIRSPVGASSKRKRSEVGVEADALGKFKDGPVPELTGSRASMIQIERRVSEGISPPKPNSTDPAKSAPADQLNVNDAAGTSSSQNTKVAHAVTVFLKRHLDPLYQAEVIDKDTYKKAVEKTRAKVMQAHALDRDASFLIAEGTKVRRLVLQYVQHMTKKNL